jgi:hypothetical protein
MVAPDPPPSCATASNGVVFKTEDLDPSPSSSSSSSAAAAAHPHPLDSSFGQRKQAPGSTITPSKQCICANA